VSDTPASAVTAPPLLEGRDLHRVFHAGASEVHALQGISISVHRGETVSITGASGAGKSTLLHVLGGLERPSSGQVRFDGRDLYAISARQRTLVRSLRIGFVFQSYHLLPELDVLENVMLPSLAGKGALRGLEAHRERARELLKRVGLEHRAVHRPTELSGGEQQRVALARALMNDPEIVLADEPTGNLDSRTGGQVLEYLFTLLSAQGRTLLMVTHNDVVAGLCRRRLVLHDGRLRE